MAKREIVDYLGNETGEHVQRFVWRSKPTKSPLTGSPVRCVVAQDEKGQYWGAARIGGEKPKYEFWCQPFATKQQATAAARGQTRDFLAADCEQYSQTVSAKKPGEKIVEVRMDDGWRLSINAPGRLSPAQRKAIAIFEKLGKGKQGPTKAPEKKRSRDWPSR